jgi:hypothetical protein
MDHEKSPDPHQGTGLWREVLSPRKEMTLAWEPKRDLIIAEEPTTRQRVWMRQWAKLSIFWCRNISDTED